MTQNNEHLDFSGLFKLDVLINLDIVTYSFYEVGLKKFLAFSSDKELVFIYFNSQGERLEKYYDWDFVDNPIYCMCFEPSGTWVLIISEQKVLLVPFLPLFIPQSTFDYKWSLSSVTVLPLGSISKPSSVVWWLTKESENILIIGSKTGLITFYSLETQSTVGECKVSGDIVDLQICFDDSLDLLALLITRGKSQQWKLVLEHRSFGYNWLQQTRAQTDKDKRDSFMSYIKQLSKDKITFFIQGGSKDDSKAQTIEHCLKPTKYLPMFRKGSNNWTLTAQYVNGRHFLTAFELNEGTMILESPEEDTPSRTLRPHIKKDGQYIQGLWTQRLIYLLRRNQLEVHSSAFSVIQGDGLLGAKIEFSELWTAELLGEVHRAHVMSAKEPPSSSGGWREPTFLCDLQLPRFTLEPCLVVTTCGAFVLNTVNCPCEWLVSLVTRGGAGAERCAVALGARVPALLRAAADLLLARGKLAPAHYLHCLSQSPPDGWVARLGVFGRLHDLAIYKHVSTAGSLGNAAITIKLLAVLLKMATNHEETFDMDPKITTLSPIELQELSSFAACVGLWDLVPVFSVHRGHPNLLLEAVKSRNEICRGALNCLISENSLITLMMKENTQWLFDFIVAKRNEFDTIILKSLCLFLNPLQDQLRPLMRDMKQGISSIYTARMVYLISTFMHVACAIESRDPCPDIHMQITRDSETWKNQYRPRRALSCGLNHWAVADEGNAKIFMANTPVDTELIGRVIDVACGRHHTLVLTENGIYAAGDNSFGQLGVGSMWRGAVGELARAHGGLARVAQRWAAPVVAVAAGHYHSAAIDLGGRLYTWGWGIHGQLGHGNIDDVWKPKLVAKFQGRKVLSVGCGACHSVVLTRSGDVFASGAGVFGQLGSGARHKATVPLRVAMPQSAVAIAVGYFHNLALSQTGCLYTWGASPQQVRAAHARRSASPSPSPTSSPSPSPALSAEPHLLPELVDTTNVRGRIVAIAAGWHHSCIVNNIGTLYTWGLNFDGQLGSGDRKQVHIPTEVRIRSDRHSSEKDSEPKSPEENKDVSTRAMAACGGDFTVYVDDAGKIYATGNAHLQLTNEKEKGANRVIMMKTTKRVIKIPTSRSNNKFLFHPIDRLDIMFPFELQELQRKNIELIRNPLASIDDFNNKSWADDIILLLKPWINEENLSSNFNMAAKYAYHTEKYSECLRLLLNNLKTSPPQDCIYLTHTDLSNPESQMRKRDERRIVISNIMSKRIKEVSLTILNEEPYPEISPEIYRELSCCCNELSYVPKGVVPKTIVNIREGGNLAYRAADIIDKCISMFPVDTNLWETCFRYSKDFYVENKLSYVELETVLWKYMKSNASTMAAAIMYSNDCSEYSEILTPKFYLNMCSLILDTWG
ncbi:uncharacterized protein ca [Plodia interpunctella]|uniref:uncharacterized protein ca n=1 Tax=Plodia interpunctella TaxID=58824 RepID=UPI00236760B3|nr:uncharacterized protein LOC128670599 [Plodia interpunctella]